MLSALFVTLISAAAPMCPEGTSLQQFEREASCVEADGRPHGPYVRWYPDGSIVERGQHDHGKRVGVWEKLYPNGRLEIRAEYENDERHGEFTLYDEDGRIREHGRYEHGRRVGQWMTTTPAQTTEDLTQGNLAAHDLSGEALLLPVQADISLGTNWDAPSRVSLSLFAVYGRLRFDRTGVGRGFFAALGGTAETNLFPSMSECPFTCLGDAMGPALRIGHATRWLAEDSTAAPALSLPDVSLYLQVAPRIERFSRLRPLGGAPQRVGIKLELGVTALGWGYLGRGPTQFVNIGGRLLALLSGLTLRNVAGFPLALGDHVSINVQTDAAGRFVGGIEVGAGL